MYNKKASLADSILVPIKILAVAMTIFIAYFIWTSFVTTFTPIATNINVSDTKNLTTTMGEITTSLSYLDYMFPFLVMGLLLVSLIFAFKTGASVVYAYVSILFWALAIVISVVYERVFEAFAANFTSISGTFTITSYIMSHVTMLCLIWAFLISTVMFVRNKQEDQNISATERMYSR